MEVILRLGVLLGGIKKQSAVTAIFFPECRVPHIAVVAPPQEIAIPVAVKDNHRCPREHRRLAVVVADSAVNVNHVGEHSRGKLEFDKRVDTTFRKRRVVARDRHGMERGIPVPDSRTGTRPRRNNGNIAPRRALFADGVSFQDLIGGVQQAGIPFADGLAQGRQPFLFCQKHFVLLSGYRKFENIVTVYSIADCGGKVNGLRCCLL